MLWPLFTIVFIASSITSTFAQVQYAGVNIAGFDFGCGTDGSGCNPGSQDPTNGGDKQMQHFVSVDKQNIFRLPVGWEYLVDTPGGPLNQANFKYYDNLVQSCIKLGVHCIIDIHNYARWNGQIIGQGGPTNADFANTWSQLATAFKGDANVVFGVMNEPHDVQIGPWAETVQAAVTAIRNAGATSQMILLPGNDWTSAGASVSDGSAAALLKVTNPSGDTKGLIYDFHDYFDSGSGTSTGCISNKISDGFQPPLDFLRQNKRQAMVTELGGGGTDTNCLTYVCEALDFLNQNSDVYIGWTAWAAGGFPATYELALLDGGGNDVPLMTQCFAAKFRGSNGTDTVGSDPIGSDTVGNGAGTSGTGSTGTGSGTGTGSSTGSGTGTGTASSSSVSPFPGSGRIGSGTSAVQPGTSGYPNGFQSFKAEAPVISGGNDGNSTSTTGSTGTSRTCKRKGKKTKRRRNGKARIGGANGAENGV